MDVEMSANIVIKCTGALLMLADESSEVNSAAFWHTSMSPAQRGARLTALVGAHKIFEYNPVLDGTFCLEIMFGCVGEVVEHINTTRIEFFLELATGKLIVRSAKEAVPVFNLPPGIYKGTLLWDHARETEHSTVADAVSYPHETGPDGQVKLSLFHSFTMS